VDCRDRLLAVIADYSLDAQGNLLPAAVEIVDGERRVLAGGPASVAQRLRPAPLPVDRAGRLNLSALCHAPAAVFDLDGYAVASEKKAAAAIYAASGSYQSAALDSRRLACVWHRVVLAGLMPERTAIVMQTTTSDVELDANELADLAPEQWSQAAPIRCMTRGVADALVCSPPGRYLWLRLVLSGDGTTTPAVTRIVVEFPRVSLRRFLPGVYGMDPASSDFTDRFTSLFDTTIRSIENRVDTFYELFDPRTAPAERSPPPPGSATSGPDFLSWLASWIGMPLSRLWPEALRRAMLKAAACYFTQRGTRTGLTQLLLTFLGFRGRGCEPSCAATRCAPRPLNCAPKTAPCKPVDPPLILEHFRLRRWMFLGAGRLGDDAMLWGKRIVNRSQLGGASGVGNARLGPLSCPADRQPATRLYSVPDPARDPFFVYAHKFTVFVPARVKSREWQRRGLEQLLASEAPAHTQWDIEYVEPRFRVGVQALIGFDSVIARVPRGIRLNDNRLGQGTVLPPQPGRRARIGLDARVGETVRL
jgi:phage tail-like protein